MYSEAEIKALAETMGQLLDDMGKSGQSVCLLAKAEARLAYEPFRPADEDFDDWMTIAEAEEVVKTAR